jgi:hypothetical protein
LAAAASGTSTLDDPKKANMVEGDEEGCRMELELERVLLLCREKVLLGRAVSVPAGNRCVCVAAE